MAGSDGRGWGIIVVAVLLFLVFMALVSHIWMPLLPWTEQRDAGEKVIEDQMDADKAIQDYRWFRQQYHDIQAQRDKVENAYEAEKEFHEMYGDDPDEWSRQAETRHGRIHERITGNKQMLEDMVADYNARSDDETRSIYQCHLPYQVDDRFAIQGPPGSDAPEQPVDSGPDGDPVDGEVPPPEQCDGLPDEVDS